MVYRLFTAVWFVFLASTQILFAQERNLSSPMDFRGRYLISVSDADMLASAYVDGKLGAPIGDDTLTILSLEGTPNSWTPREVPASNSVAGPPASVDITSDGKYAFVIETWGQRPRAKENATFKDLKFGNRLQVFDLSDSKNPKMVQDIAIPLRPDAIRVNLSGSLIAITFHNKGGGARTPLGLFPFSDGKIGTPVYPKIKGWNIKDRMIDVDWHPSENILALLNESASNIRFARVDEKLGVTPFGNVVQIEKAPFRVKFTPDGRHVVINALYWGSDIAGRWIEAPRGSVLTVRMNAGQMIAGTTGAQPRHAMISTIKTGVSPEGLAVSPDGKWVVTTNLERSYLPYNDKRISWYSSLTLASLDQKTGQLERIGDFSYDGILPEAAVFDNSSSYLAVATYDHFNDRIKGGSIDFWHLVTDPLEPKRVQLLKTNLSIPVTRGVHSLVIAR